MRWSLALCCASLVGVGLAPQPSEGPSALGRGGFTIEHDDKSLNLGPEKGTASVNFKLFAGRSPNGSLLYSAEDHQHGRYPHIVVRLTQIRSMTIEGKTAHLLGEAEFHDEPSQIEVIIVDGGPRGKGDRFTIRVKQGDAIAYERTSEIGVGDFEVVQ